MNEIDNNDTLEKTDKKHVYLKNKSVSDQSRKIKHKLIIAWLKKEHADIRE